MPSLLEQYLGTSDKPTEAQSVGTSLIDHYLAGAPASVATPVIEAERAIAPPMSGYTQEQSDRRNLELSNIAPAQEQSAISKAATNVSGLPVEYWDNVKKNYQGGVELAVSGLKDIGGNQSASGIGKLGLGGLMAVPPVPLITGALSTAGQEITKLTGSKDIGDRAEMILGSGFPVAKAGQMAIKAMPSNKAVSAIVDTIGGPDKIKSVIDELRSNPRLTLMDVVPATQRMAQKLITTEGQHQNKFEKFVQDRIGSGKSATSDIYDASMGTPVNVVDKVNSLKQAAKDVGKNEIEPAVKNSGFVDVSNVINNIDAKLKPGVNSIISAGEPLALGDIEKPLAAVRQFIMDEKSVRTDPKSLHQFQSALRAKADDLMNSQSGQDRQKGYALMGVRNDIVEAIDKASGGTYKPALSKFRDEKQVENAFQMGQLVTRNKLGRLEDSPEFWDNWVKTASPQELEAAREGARLAVQHQIGGFKAGARKGQDIVESEFNKDKLSSLFGNDEIAKMTKMLKDERNIAITNQQLVGNSQTAMRMKADSRVDLPTEKPITGVLPVVAAAGEGLSYMGGGVPGIATAVTSIAALGKKAKFKYADLPLAKARNEHITNLLTATGDDREALIKILESKIPQQKPTMLQRAQNFALPVLPP